LLYTADLLTTTEATTATFAVDTPVLAMDKCSRHCFIKTAIQPTYQNCFKVWRRANGSKSVQAIFTIRRETCPTPGRNKQLVTPQDPKKKMSSLSAAP
jgi:hypothetical protein